MQKTLSRVYVKVHISNFLARLKYLDQLYAEGYRREYLQQMTMLYGELLRSPQVQDDAGGTPLHSGPLLTTIGSLIGNGDADGLNTISPNLAALLERVYDLHGADNSGTKRLKRIGFSAALAAFILLCVVSLGRLKERYQQEKIEYDLLANEEVFKKKTIDGLLSLDDALKRYYNDHHAFPRSSGGMDAAVSADGTAKQDWIQGLVPRYIKELPTDPRRSKDPGNQYMYRSDGKDFKLIAHRPLGMEEVVKNRPELVDPVRPSWAFGVWSAGAKDW